MPKVMAEFTSYFVVSSLSLCSSSVGLCERGAFCALRRDLGAFCATDEIACSPSLSSSHGNSSPVLWHLGALFKNCLARILCFIGIFPNHYVSGWFEPLHIFGCID